MARTSPHEQQTHRDIRRARTLVAQVRGWTTHEASEALEKRASEGEVSIHAAALAVLATSPTDVLLTHEPSS